MGVFIDLTGQRFGRWTVLEKHHSEPSRGWFWLCRCSCEDKTEKVVRGSILKNGDSQSCECLKRETTANINKSHGMTGTPTYQSWQNMKKRCYNENDEAYINYGSRGIKVCDRWLDSFENFLADMGVMPEGHTIERVDNNGIYEPTNCIWLIRAEQNKNKTTSLWIEYNGETKIQEDWARQYNISSSALNYRLKLGMSFEEAINKEVSERTVLYRYNGEEKTTTELSTIAGVSPKTITERIRDGWTVEEAVETPTAKNKSANLEWEGKTWSITDLAKHLGMSHQTLHGRLNKYGMTLEEAIKTPLKKSGRYNPNK